MPLTDHAVKLAPLVPLRLAQAALRLARAELAEILRRFGDHLFEQLDFDPAQRLAWPWRQRAGLAGGRAWEGAARSTATYRLG